MTVSVNVTRINKMDRPTPGLPIGVEVFSMFGTVTSGVGSGNNDTLFNFNGGASRNFQPYVAITKVQVDVTVADPTDGVMFLLPSNWERTVRAGVTGIPPLLSLVTTPGNGAFQANNADNHMLGRTQLGTTGSLYIRFPEIDTAVHFSYIEGLISDRPFIIPSEIKV